MNIKKGFGMAQSFAQSLVSRGFTNKKTEPYTKKLRVLSCFGNEINQGELPPCEHLKKSKTEGKFFCGGCGCGDRKNTWLNSATDEYSKLDFPNLSCPLKMPGFSNYEPSEPEEAIDPITRRYYIETVDDSIVESISTTTPIMPDDVEKALDKRYEDIKNKK